MWLGTCVSTLCIFIKVSQHTRCRTLTLTGLHSSILGTLQTSQQTFHAQQDGMYESGCRKTRSTRRWMSTSIKPSLSYSPSRAQLILVRTVLGNNKRLPKTVMMNIHCLKRGQMRHALNSLQYSGFSLSSKKLIERPSFSFCSGVVYFMSCFCSNFGDSAWDHPVGRLSY